MATRTYTVGAPVDVTVNDDGSLSIVVYLGEIAEAQSDAIFEDDTLTGDAFDLAESDTHMIVNAINANNVREVKHSTRA